MAKRLDNLVEEWLDELPTVHDAGGFNAMDPHLVTLARYAEQAPFAEWRPSERATARQVFQRLWGINGRDWVTRS